MTNRDLLIVFAFCVFLYIMLLIFVPGYDPVTGLF